MVDRTVKKPPKKPKQSLVSRSKIGLKKPRSVSLTTPDPILSSYLKEIHKYPLLTKEEEKELALKYYETKDREALQRLVTSNLRFVVKIAYEYVHYRVKLLDLIQEGNMGLVKAVEDFNPFKEVRLTTYAVWWIRSYIQDAVLKNYSLVKIGTTQSQKRLFYRLRREQKKLDQVSMPNSQKVALLAEKLDVTPKEIEEMDSRLNGGDLSLNAPTYTQKSDHLQNLSDSATPVDTSLADAEQRTIFHKILAQFAGTLEGRDKVFFSDRLVAETPLTLEEIGKKYGVSKERARQIEESLKGKLKSYVEAHYPDYNLLISK